MAATAQSRSISADERRERILDLFKLRTFYSIPELSERLGVSTMTVRRDLEAIARKGPITLVHGGASLSGPLIMGTTIGRRLQEHSAEKEAIGRLAASLVHDGDAVALDAGSTVYHIARHLTARHVTVVTHSLPVINELADRDGVTMIGLGGVLHSQSLSFSGPQMHTLLKNLRVTTLFLAATGVTLEDGISCGNLYDAETKQSLISIARDVVLVADHSKFGKIAAVTVAPLMAVRTVVSDEGLAPSTRHSLTNKGLTVRLAPVRPVQTDGASDGTARP
jgi:DeoR/GlpR family transcriptional regulator of sugar metabolism